MLSFFRKVACSLLAKKAAKHHASFFGDSVPSDRMGQILKTCRDHGQPENGETVLFWQHGGMSGLLRLEAYFALALQFRGYTPHFIICDGVAPACLVRDTEKDSIEEWPKRCAGCIQAHKSIIERFGFSYTMISELLAQENLSELYAEMPEKECDVDVFVCQEKDLSANLLSGLIRVNRHCDLSALTSRHIKEFAFDAACNWLAMNEALRRVKPSSIFMSHCIFTDFGPAYQAARDNGTHVFGYQRAHKSNCMLFFSHPKDFPISAPGCSISDEIWAEIKAEHLNEPYDSIMKRFYSERYESDGLFNDMKGYFHDVCHERDTLLAHYHIPQDKPVFAFFSQIRWDSSADFSGLIFKSYDDFILASLREMVRNTKVFWLIKVHPAEQERSFSARTVDFISEHFPKLPPHVAIVPHDSPFSPLDIFNVIDGAITACGTAGLEVAAMGKPVITAARYLYANKGFTYDSGSIEQFCRHVRHAEMLQPLSKEQKQMARRYLVAYLYRQAIPIAPLSNVTWDLSNIEELHQLLPGNNRYIDLIMDSFKKQQSPLLPLEWI